MEPGKKEETLFISYNWNDGGVLAEELENQLSDYFDIKRDRSCLKINDDIYGFMAGIANYKNVVIVLTREYVKSINCMLEVSYLLQQPDWSEKVMVLVVDDTIYSTERKIEILNYWDIKKKQLEKSADGIAENIINDEIEKIAMINDKLEEFLRGISRINNPSQVAIVNELVRRMKNRNNRVSIVTQGEQKVVELLKMNGAMSISEISEHSLYSKAYTHRLLAGLLEREMIDKVGNEKVVRYVLKNS